MQKKESKMYIRNPDSTITLLPAYLPLWSIFKFVGKKVLSPLKPTSISKSVVPLLNQSTRHDTNVNMSTHHVVQNEQEDRHQPVRNLPSVSQVVFTSKRNQHGFRKWTLADSHIPLATLSETQLPAIISRNLLCLKFYSSELSYVLRWTTQHLDVGRYQHVNSGQLHPETIQFLTSVKNYDPKRLYLHTDNHNDLMSYPLNYEHSVTVTGCSELYVVIPEYLNIEVTLSVDLYLPKRPVEVIPSLYSKCGCPLPVLEEVKDGIYYTYRPRPEFDHVYKVVYHTYQFLSASKPLSSLSMKSYENKSILKLCKNDTLIYNDELSAPQTEVYTKLHSMVAYDNTVWTNTAQEDTRIGNPFYGFYALSLKDHNSVATVSYQLKLNPTLYPMKYISVLAAKYESGSTFTNHVKYNSKTNTFQDVQNEHRGSYPPDDGSLITGSLELEPDAENFALVVGNDKFGILGSDTKDLITFVNITVIYSDSQ